MSRSPNWSEFDHHAPVSAPTPDADFDALAATALGGGAGAQLLSQLRQRYIERAENPLTTEAALRVRVTQQQFVRELETAVQRGLAARKTKPKP